MALNKHTNWIWQAELGPSLAISTGFKASKLESCSELLKVRDFGMLELRTLWNGHSATVNAANFERLIAVLLFAK